MFGLEKVGWLGYTLDAGKLLEFFAGLLKESKSKSPKALLLLVDYLVEFVVKF